MTYENYRKELLKQAESLNAFLETVTDPGQFKRLEFEVRRVLSEAARIKEMHIMEARRRRQTITMTIESRIKYPILHDT